MDHVDVKLVVAGNLEERRHREIEITPGMDPKKRKAAFAAAAVNATLRRRIGIWRPS